MFGQLGVVFTISS